jgi:hypothetical protein
VCVCVRACVRVCVCAVREPVVLVRQMRNVPEERQRIRVDVERQFRPAAAGGVGYCSTGYSENSAAPPCGGGRNRRENGLALSCHWPLVRRLVNEQTNKRTNEQKNKPTNRTEPNRTEPNRTETKRNETYERSEHCSRTLRFASLRTNQHNLGVARLRTRTCPCVHTRSLTHARTHARKQTHKHARTHTHKHTRHTHTHTHTHHAHARTHHAHAQRPHS